MQAEPSAGPLLCCPLAVAQLWRDREFGIVCIVWVPEMGCHGPLWVFLAGGHGLLGLHYGALLGREESSIIPSVTENDPLSV